MHLSAPLCALALLVVACGDDGNRTTSTTNGVTMGASITATAAETTATTSGETPTTGATTSSGGPTSQATTDDSGPASTTGDVIKIDVGTTGATLTTAPPDEGCKKVDFMFVIDNSASMEDNQAALIASFPGFIAAIKATLSASSDYQIMVVDTDDDGRCKQPCSADAVASSFCAVKPNACNAKLDACDVTRGAGVVHPVGEFSSNVVCPITGGNRYMLPEEPDLEGTFACVATVGVAGNASERPMNGMTEAVGQAINAPGGCNAGFVRDDALLVILFLSDDPNYEDEGTPQSWYDAVLAAKKGNKDAVVVAGLIPPTGKNCKGDAVPMAMINGAHWAEFIGMWGDHGIAGSICELDYAPFFTEAVGIIDNACDNFIPG